MPRPDPRPRVNRFGHSQPASSKIGMTPFGAVDDVIEPGWLWPQRTMPPNRRGEEMPGEPERSRPPTIVGFGDSHRLCPEQPNSRSGPRVLT